MEQPIKVTIFQNIKDTKTPHWVDIETIFKRIRDGKSKDKIDAIRKESDKDERNKLKMHLPSICFSGQFDERNNNAIREHSGLICLDFDDVDPTETKLDLMKDEYIFAAFVSPSGNGVKALVKIPANKETHLGSFLAIQERYNSIDAACKDLARVCYESADRELYINRESKVFENLATIERQSVKVSKPLTDMDKVYENIKKWLDKKGEYFTQGNRNNFLCKIASACNRFGIDQSECKHRLTYDFVNGGSDFDYKEFEQVLKSVYSNYGAQFGTASFEDEEIVEIETKKNVTKEVLDMELPPKDVIHLIDVYRDMYHDFKYGQQMGISTGFDFIDEHFTWLRGDLTLLHGIGNHGKSTFFSRLCMNKAIDSNWRFGIFSPEQYPPKFFYNELIQMYVGETVLKGDFQMTEEKYVEAAKFVNDRFFYVFPEDNEPTPDYINERFSELIAKYRVDCVIVDPFNQLYHDYTERDDKYLSKILTSFKRFATMNNIHYTMIAHPNGRVGKTKDGNLEMPYFTELSGGMMWANKCDNILCYHRPNFKTDPRDRTCIFSAQKIKKQQIVGIPGQVKMNYVVDGYTYERQTEEEMAEKALFVDFDNI